MTPRLYIGTAGLSVWYSDDLGETLQRFWGASGLYSETRVWALSAHSDRPGELLAGTDSGLYRLDVGGGKWTHLPSVMDDMCIWSVARSPHDPDRILAGTRPPGIFRSTDAGATWVRINDDHHQWGAVFPLTGDPRIFGRVYIGTNGRGIIYGDSDDDH